MQGHSVHPLFPSAFHHEGTPPYLRKKQEGPHLTNAGTLILDLPASRTVRNKTPVLYKLPSLRYFVVAAQNEPQLHVSYTLLQYTG
jgi:hypothetical protein